MATSAIVTRGFLFAVKFVVTAGYSAAAVVPPVAALVKPSTLTTRDVPFIYQPPKRQKRKQVYVASGHVRWSRNIQAEMEYWSERSEEDILVAVFTMRRSN